MLFRCLVWLTVIAVTSFAQGTVDHLRNAKAVSDKLRPVIKPDDIGPEPDPLLIGQLKREVREWLTGRIASAPRTISPTQLTAQLKEAAGQVGLLVRDGDYESNPYGTILDFRVVPVLHAPDLLQIIVSYNSYCAPDDSLLLFEQKQGRWQLVLNFDNTDLTHQWGDRALLYSGVSPRDSRGQYYVLVVRTRSYCPLSGSTWNNVNYHVLRPGVEPASPVVLLSENHGYHADEDFRAELKVANFTLDFPGGSESAGYIRIFKYSVLGNRVRRVEPYAVNPVEFIGEWLTVPWAEAAEWSDPAGLESLRNWHDNLKGKFNFFVLGTPFVQYCSAGHKLMQVGFPEDFDPSGTNSPLFVVRELRVGVWRVMNVAVRSLDGCTELRPLPAEAPFRLLPETLTRAKSN